MEPSHLTDRAHGRSSSLSIPPMGQPPCLSRLPGARLPMRRPGGLTAVSGTFYFGGLPQEIVLWNIRRLAEEVMPAFEGVKTR